MFLLVVYFVLLYLVDRTKTVFYGELMHHDVNARKNLYHYAYENIYLKTITKTDHLQYRFISDSETYAL